MWYSSFGIIHNISALPASIVAEMCYATALACFKYYSSVNQYMDIVRIIIFNWASQIRCGTTGTFSLFWNV